LSQVKRLTTDRRKAAGRCPYWYQQSAQVADRQEDECTSRPVTLPIHSSNTTDNTMPFSLRFRPHDIYPDAIEARLAELHEIAEDVQRAQERRWRKYGTLLPQGVPSQGNPHTRH
jgi:hypothetical protein